MGFVLGSIVVAAVVHKLAVVVVVAVVAHRPAEQVAGVAVAHRRQVAAHRLAEQAVRTVEEPGQGQVVAEHRYLAVERVLVPKSPKGFLR